LLIYFRTSPRVIHKQGIDQKGLQERPLELTTGKKKNKNGMLQTKNATKRGRLSTVDLLI
jgi:hypothetical protein